MWSRLTATSSRPVGRTLARPGRRSTPPTCRVSKLSGHGRGCNTLTGSFSITELTFDGDGRLESLLLSFVQHCEGGVPAAYGTIAWHSSTAAPPAPPKLTMKLAGKHAAYGKKVMVEAQLSGASANREVSVYARLGNGKEQLLTRGSVEATGRLAVRVKLTETATIIARLSGGDAFPDPEAAQDVTVAGKLRCVPRQGSQAGEVPRLPVLEERHDRQSSAAEPQG